MSINWVIAPYESEWPEAWEQVWEFDRQHGIISIGWPGLGDVSKSSLDQLKEVVAPHEAHMLHKFYHAINEGDTIVARYGRNWIAGVGTVKRTAYYDPGKTAELFAEFDDANHAYPHHLEVEWNPEWTWDGEYWDCGHQAFGMQTLHTISTEKLNALLYGSDDESEEDWTDEDWEKDSSLPPAQFVLEKYLENFIVDNFDRIFERQLEILKENDRIVGKQYAANEVGFIDILCRDVGTNDLVVIELKKGRESDKVVGQLLRYMGWVAENLCEDGQSVRGIVICKDSDAKLQYALKPVPNVSVKYFKVDFELGDEPFG